jgi:hypothetical protein
VSDTRLPLDCVAQLLMRDEAVVLLRRIRKQGYGIRLPRIYGVVHGHELAIFVIRHLLAHPLYALRSLDRAVETRGWG